MQICDGFGGWVQLFCEMYDCWIRGWSHFLKSCFEMTCQAFFALNVWIASFLLKKQAIHWREIRVTYLERIWIEMGSHARQCGQMHGITPDRALNGAIKVPCVSQGDSIWGLS